MPKSGCPRANGFYWNTGYILQDLEDTNSVTRVSPNSHLLGWVSNDVVRYFCIKNNTSATVDSKRFRWPAGEYCIYQRGSRCPKGLLSGSVLWDDENSATGTNKNSHAGVLPAGAYNQDTKIFFCCQTTGSHDDPIELPVASPFYLIAFTPQCQEVLNTIHTLEYIVYDTEDNNNRDWKTFPYPYGVSSQEPTIYYCYYKGIAAFDVARFNACVACEQSLMRCGTSKGEASRDEPDSTLPLLVPQRMRDCSEPNVCTAVEFHSCENRRGSLVSSVIRDSLRYKSPSVDEGRAGVFS